jgi:hypothetical protein
MKSGYKQRAISAFLQVKWQWNHRIPLERWSAVAREEDIASALRRVLQEAHLLDPSIPFNPNHDSLQLESLWLVYEMAEGHKIPLPLSHSFESLGIQNGATLLCTIQS